MRRSFVIVLLRVVFVVVFAASTSHAPIVPNRSMPTTNILIPIPLRLSIGYTSFLHRCLAAERGKNPYGV
jgi:hypothetical protein